MSLRDHMFLKCHPSNNAVSLLYDQEVVNPSQNAVQKFWVSSNFQSGKQLYQYAWGIQDKYLKLPKGTWGQASPRYRGCLECWWRTLGSPSKTLTSLAVQWKLLSSIQLVTHFMMLERGEKTPFLTTNFWNTESHGLEVTNCKTYHDFCNSKSLQRKCLKGDNMTNSPKPSWVSDMTAVWKLRLYPIIKAPISLICLSFTVFKTNPLPEVH